MTEKEYKALYNRIKEDLYDEFLNPETATYGADVLRHKENKRTGFLSSFNLEPIDEKEIIKEEIEQLMLVMKKYEENEEYEKAAVMKKRIIYLKNQL